MAWTVELIPQAEAELLTGTSKNLLRARIAASLPRSPLAYLLDMSRGFAAGLLALRPLATVFRGALTTPPDILARFLHIAGLLQDFGPQHVGMPHIRPLEGKLWEMRMKGKDGIARAVYVARSGQRLTVLHVFAKKTQKTPRQAIETALKRLQEIEP